MLDACLRSKRPAYTNYSLQISREAFSNRSVFISNHIFTLLIMAPPSELIALMTRGSSSSVPNLEGKNQYGVKGMLPFCSGSVSTIQRRICGPIPPGP